MTDDTPVLIHASPAVKEFAAALGLPEPGPWTQDEWDAFQAKMDAADARLAEIQARRRAEREA
ncbi:hypothetical protein Ade02nite_21560 [Paractinoplanes deccanensis]|uniref:Uncharacterized protein n=1 Tax=Paractinoplanes deccanensis TaxID=113561 RepID=A0ABQ3Y0Y1_9ACTN|nr:hypothetical protein [Actinoplanes deccanensis]GID73515.1 hypothetical protein Ade02nite_21560 [Actinoplanes deccanensis]